MELHLEPINDSNRSQALELHVAHGQETYVETVYLSVIEGNDAAIALYQKFGFQFNGERDVHQEKVMVRPA